MKKLIAGACYGAIHNALSPPPFAALAALSKWQTAQAKTGTILQMKSLTRKQLASRAEAFRFTRDVLSCVS